MSPPQIPSQWTRLLVALSIGIACAWLSSQFIRNPNPDIASDFTYPWLASRALWIGADPYAYVTQFPALIISQLFYPATAGVVLLPFAPLSAQAAAPLFVGLGCGLLAFAVTRDGWWRLWIFTSSPLYAALGTGQWSPLLTASAILTPLLGLVVAKPNLALPLVAMQRSPVVIARAFLLGLVVLAVSLILAPGWPLHWYQTMRGNPYAAQYIIPVATLLGVPLALAFFRLGSWDGRLLAAMACVPQNFYFYDQLPLMLIYRTRPQLIAAALVSWVAYFGRSFLHLRATSPQAISAQLAPFVILGLYYPALAIVLRRRG